MEPLNVIDWPALSQATDSTFGRASTNHDTSRSIKFSMHGNVLIAKYLVVVNFMSDAEIIPLRAKYEDEADQYLKRAVAKVKIDYKELCGKTLSTKGLDADSSYEFVNFNAHNFKRTAYFRRTIRYTLS